MGKEELLSKIKLEFETEANKITGETELKIRQMEKENDEKIAAKRHEIFADLHKNLEDIRRKDLIETDIKIRSLLLEVKQNLINDIFKEVQVKIKGEDYHKLIENMLMSSVQNGEGEVVFSKEDSKIFTEDFINGINSKLKALGKNSRFMLSKKYGNFSGGFVLRYSGIEINNTFETIFGYLRKDLEMEIGKILFPEK
ncbi:MAG: V-type ATP synthase subunit E [bacterium]|nr:V-type ATP synthase subunit E [bacterium]